MGCYNFRPARVHEATTRILRAYPKRPEPAWYDTVGGNPPAQILVRSQPVQHIDPSTRKYNKKRSKQFRPQRIHYEEDILRKQFFADHPWELARPRVVLEDSGRDFHRQDWSSLRQRTRALDGESVIQRQIWLRKNAPGMTREQAYDQARKEFYDQRMQDEVEARVAKEEALAVSAYFGKTAVEVGMELEDETYERWRKEAIANVTLAEQKKASAISTYGSEAEEETPVNDSTSALDAVGTTR